MYYFLGTCAAGTPSTGCRAVLARRSPSPASRAFHPQDCSTRTTVVRWSQRCAPRRPRSRQHGPRCRSRRLLAAFFRPLWTHARRHPRAPRGSLTPCASPLHGDRQDPTGIQLAEAARSRALRHSPSKSSHGQFRSFVKAKLALRLDQSNLLCLRFS